MPFDFSHLGCHLSPQIRDHNTAIEIKRASQLCFAFSLSFLPASATIFTMLLSRRWVMLVLTLLASISAAYSQISKGQRILIERGLQIQGMVTRDDVFHLTTYSNANYTSINWLWTANPSLMGNAPGFPWSRWVNNETLMPPQAGEGPYMSQLVSLQLGDEWHLNDPTLRTRAVDWFNAIRTNFPNTILYMNNWGSQVGDAELADFTSRARPDMLCFDAYPWKSDYTTRVPIGGPPTSWYGDLRRYREHARASNLPLGCYMQTFHSVQDYDQTVYRDPSSSELRLNHFAALAFNAKVLIDFTYNTGASSLFTTPGGDSNPTPLLAEKTDIARRARNFGKALVQLKPVTNAVSPYTTSIMFIRGRNSSGTINPVPNSFLTDPEDPTTTEWLVNRNDPYLRGWAVTNIGTRNNGRPGDVIVSWFIPLDETLDGFAHSNQVYMMVVNGLTDPAGSALDCRQEIRLNFAFTNGITALEMLDPLTGLLQTNTLPVVNTRNQLVLSLNGGDGVLFKFANGAPFVGVSVVDTNDPAMLVASSATWRYWDNLMPPPANWAATNFNDSSWRTGPAQLGFGDGDEATVINANRSRMTTYFRRAFNVADPFAWSGLHLELLRDDGAVAYVNGTEVFRSNMPAGLIDSTTQAQAEALSGDERTNFYSASVDAALLRRGTNVVAVEVHQFGTNSDDLSFALRLTGTNPAPTSLVAAGSTWRYLDTGVAPAAAWTNQTFNDAAWKPGAAQLGYGDGDEATVVGYGPDANNKHITTWFRRAFTVVDPGAIHYVNMRVIRDDGVVVYLNGAEIFRNNMPAGVVTATTRALTGISGADESAWLTRAVSPELLRTGANIIAAEIHQNTNNSSDISFDLELLAYTDSALPRVSASLLTNTVAFTWPQWAGDYRLMTAPNVSTSAVWSAVPGTPLLSNGQWTLTTTVVTNGRRFFRLQK